LLSYKHYTIIINLNIFIRQGERPSDELGDIFKILFNMYL